MLDEQVLDSIVTMVFFEVFDPYCSFRLIILCVNCLLDAVAYGAEHSFCLVYVDVHGGADVAVAKVFGYHSYV